jgi:hypothetical protein
MVRAGYALISKSAGTAKAINTHRKLLVTLTPPRFNRIVQVITQASKDELKLTKIQKIKILWSMKSFCQGQRTLEMNQCQR